VGLEAPAVELDQEASEREPHAEAGLDLAQGRIRVRAQMLVRLSSTRVLTFSICRRA
jgi:hypothetical protein